MERTDLKCTHRGAKFDHRKAVLVYHSLMTQNPDTPNKLIFRIVVLSSVACISGLTLLLFSIFQATDAMAHGAVAQQTLFTIGTFHVGPALVVVALTGSISLGCTVSIGQTVVRLVNYHRSKRSFENTIHKTDIMQNPPDAPSNHGE